MTTPKHPPRVWLDPTEIDVSGKTWDSGNYFTSLVESGQTEYLSLEESNAITASAVSEAVAEAEEKLLLKMARYCGMVRDLEEMHRDLTAEYEKAKAARTSRAILAEGSGE